MSNINLIRLTSGELIISDVQGPVSEETVILKNPASVIFQRNQVGGVEVGLAPFMPLKSESATVTLYISAIAAETEPDVELINEYNSKFGSGIVLANVMPGN